MGAWRRLHTRAEEGRLLIVYQLLVSFTSPRGLLLSVPLPDRVWTSSIGRRLLLGLPRLLTVTTRRARFADFEARHKTAPGPFPPRIYCQSGQKQPQELDRSLH